MREVLPEVWIGNSRDVRDLKQIEAHGIQAVVELAADAPPVQMPAEIVYFRCPLSDDEESADWKIDVAIQMVGLLLVGSVPVLVACRAGMNRSPAIVAAALALAEDEPLDKALQKVTAAGPCDISPVLWEAIEERFSDEE
jgi:protein-tyrosine phosphatase